MARKAGFEPATVALTGRCSAIELLTNSGHIGGIRTRVYRFAGGRLASWLRYDGGRCRIRTYEPFGFQFSRLVV